MTYKLSYGIINNVLSKKYVLQIFYKMEELSIFQVGNITKVNLNLCQLRGDNLWEVLKL
ncbi:hypothetical protein CLOSBL3_20234 [Clostridiaceae bacterium BL-3]|nr:hypothetical protein CLOSBL3_20234 [Clostridiaceae bacterium BL-3]